MTKLTDLLQAPEVASDDQLYIVDTSDITDDPAGSSRRVPLSDLTQTVLAKARIASVTDPGVSGFTFAIPTGTTKVWIEGNASSSRSAVGDNISVFFNGGSSPTGYYRQQNTASNGTISGVEAADDASVGFVSGATAFDPSSRFVSIMVDHLGAGTPAYAVGQTVIRRESNWITGQINYTDSNVTAEVTSITIASRNGEQLSGTLTCYAERELTVLALS